MVSTTYPKKILLDAVGASEKEIVAVLHDIKCSVESSDNEGITVEMTGDRPDLLSVYGGARALRGYLGKQSGLAACDFAPSGIKVFVEPEAESIRPVLVAAVVRDVQLDDAKIQHLFQVQEKLDMTNGRRRKKGSIGLYDLDNLKPPFHLKNASMDTAFHPLKADKKMTVKQILAEHPTGRDYAHLVKGKNYPMLVDSKGEILSLVDIINGVSSAVTEKTKNVFIDITGTDLYSCNATLNVLCQDFADQGATVQTVDIHHASKKLVTPDTKPEKFVLNVDRVNKLLGTTLPPKKVVELLRRQRLDVTVGREVLECFTPRYRSDFLHEIDLVEEVALAHGYNNFPIKEPAMFTVGSKSRQTYITQDARDVLASFGFVEAMTHVFFAPHKADRSRSSERLVEIANPVSEEYTALRSEILPSLLEVLSKNTHQPYPQNIFEVGEVIVHDGKSSTQTRTDVQACLVAAHPAASLSEVASLHDMFAKRLGHKAVLKPLSHERFIGGRAASIHHGAEKTGFLGELHPQVLENYGIAVPVSVFEIRLVKGEH
ncbi:MAG: phenylalanine--tRNA ligase subunit beta [Candidatus Micrarchaeota archaeon]|nr:phenylalanine--tRNA ligase subunit beta [Candidatus Micrarchaeota archaeon]